MSTFAEIQFPAAPVILGARLHPLTLGHALLLERLASPFLSSSPSPFVGRGERAGVRGAPGLGDLLLFREVCRHETARVPSLWRLRCQSWGFRRASTLAVQTACHDIAAWLQDTFTGPTVWREADGEDYDSGVPLMAGLKIGLMSRLHKSEAEALRTPIRLALHELVSLSALEGRLELITGEDRKMMAEAQALKAAEAAGTAPAASSPGTPEPEATKAAPTGSAPARTDDEAAPAQEGNLA